MKRARKPAVAPADPVAQVTAALLAGTLGEDDLTARGLGAFFGKTTGHLYHQWGSLDALLFLVSKSGYRHLLERLGAQYAARRDLGEVAAAFVAFGLDHPALFRLMFAHPFDWGELRARGLLAGEMPGLEVFRALAAQHGEEPARLLYAGLVGLVSLAASGRANVGRVGQSDRDVACESARALARRLTASESRCETEGRDDRD